MDLELATKLNAELLDLGDRLNNALLEIQKSCEEEEFQQYRKAFGTVMGVMYLDILGPIYRDYPNLQPEGLRKQKTEQHPNDSE
jgi:hypothetical protein